MKGLAGKRAIVTGSARGLGAVIARGYVEAGLQVTCLDKSEARGRATAEAIGAGFQVCDIADPEAVERAFDAATSEMGGLDVLAAVAGLDKPGYEPQDIPMEVWVTVMSVNATGTFLTNQAAFRRMTSGGRIINFASFAGVRGYGERAAYAASKGAVLAWTRSAAQAWGAHGVTVNSVAPQMMTEVAETFLATLNPADRAKREARWRDAVPVGGRLGEPVRDLLPLMLFLAGEGSAFITGQTFAVDGGMTMLGS